ncbi:hypothetical protein NDU88_004639 [Pleurodeles waltl]|uniref:Uncharacterized protein n=1 Tax=Pleurodeles waltl TaxID=8319 RepID=A0AAV7VHN1_PLEWA|nr:hypothetical protein NDU88_004639 [Pleurodeles waltl]
MGVLTGESSVQYETLVVEDADTRNGRHNGWDLVQQAFVQLTQEIKELFTTSEENQKDIQATCSSLEAKIQTLTLHTQDLEDGFQDLQTVVQENSRELMCFKLSEKDLFASQERIENNARRNNVRILCVKEGMEEADVKIFVINLLKNSFPQDSLMDIPEA